MRARWISLTQGTADASNAAKTYFSQDTVAGGGGGSGGSVAPLEETRFITMMGAHLGELSDAPTLLDAFSSFDEKDEGVVDVHVLREVFADEPDLVRWRLARSLTAAEAVARAVVHRPQRQALRLPEVYVMARRRALTHSRDDPGYV